MAYKVVSDFVDMLIDGHQYKEGDIYPHTGEADEARVKHLMTPTSQRGSLLVEVANEIRTEKPVNKRKAKEK